MFHQNLILSIAMVVISLAFLVFTVYQVKRNKLLLRYSLLWMLLAVLMFVFAIFPQPVFSLASAAGFSVGSNFIFFVAIFFLLVMALTQTRALSKQILMTKELAQRQAIIEKRLREGSVQEDQR